MKGRITMEDVAKEIGLVKWQLEAALSRRGLAQNRLNGVASELETLAKQLKEDPDTAALSFSPPDLTLVRKLLDDYTTEQRDVREHADALRLLRVPEEEIKALLK
jgi:hypothetical protein